MERRRGIYFFTQDSELKKLVSEIGVKNWKKISQNLINKTPVQCLHRWTKILKPGLTKGPWSIEEDRKLLEWVRMEGPTQWSKCAKYISGRSGKQCRERWFNTLHPEVKKGGWDPKEDYIIFESFSKFGSKWSKMAKELPGRTENSIKNRFYSTLRRISSETMKTRPQCEKIQQNSSFNTACPSLVELLNYFPQALEEKKTLYEQYKDLSGDLSLKFPTEQKDPIFLQKKTSRKNTRITNNINNTINLNLNIDQNLIQGLKPKPKSENIESLGKAIDNWCGQEMKLHDTLFETLETKINKLIENDSRRFEFPSEEEHTKKTHSNDCYTNLLSQLTDLEKILQVTKQEIYQSYENVAKTAPAENQKNNQFTNPSINQEEKLNLFSPLDMKSLNKQNFFLPQQNTFDFNHPNFTNRFNEDPYEMMGMEHLFKFN